MKKACGHLPTAWLKIWSLPWKMKLRKYFKISNQAVSPAGEKACFIFCPNALERRGTGHVSGLSEGARNSARLALLPRRKPEIPQTSPFLCQRKACPPPLWRDRQGHSSVDAEVAQES